MGRRIGAWIGGGLVIGFVRLRLRLPDGLARWMAGAVGMAGRWLIPGRRRVVARNLRRAFPDIVDADRNRLNAAIYRGTAGWFNDLLLLFREGRETNIRRYRLEGAEHLRDALARGKGVIAVSAHLGPFPGLAVGLSSFDAPFSFLYRKPKERRIRALFDDWIQRSGGGIIEDAPRHTAGLRCLQALAKGEVVCLLADQHFPAGVAVPFFGHPAKTGIGAALLAARSGAPLLPVRATAEPDGRVSIRIEPALDPPQDRSREALTHLTAALTARIESWIKEDPAGWFWLHRRWKDLDRAEDAAAGSTGG